MIVVTGGAGFIGSNLIAALLGRKYHEIVVVDEFGSENKWKNLAKHEVAEVVVPGDLFNWLNKNKSSVEIIFHIGAIASTTEVDVDLIIRNNFVLSANLWDWCSENQVRFVYASSYATFGDGAQGFEDDNTLEYLSKLRPLNPYGWGKNLFDMRVARAVAQKKKLPPQWAGMKYFNVYGPNEYHKGTQKSVLCQMYPHAAKSLPVRLFKSENPKYKDGEQLRDFVYVKDCNKVALWLYDNPKINGLFNVGSGKARTYIDLADAMFKGLGKKTRLEYVDMPAGVKDKFQYFTEASLTKLRAAGYTEAFTSLEDGVADYVKNYLSAADQFI